jgi:hypothetical protein
MNNDWHVGQLAKDRIEAVAADPSRPLRGHPPLKGEGETTP